MAAKEASFDVVSEMNMEEVKNAMQIALKEIKNRFDFKDSLVDIKLENGRLVVIADDDYKVEQVKDVLFAKLVKREVPIKNIQFTDSEKALGGTALQYGDLISGIDKDNGKKINTAIKKSGLKVKSQYQEDKIRVTGKSRDDLQQVISLLRKLDLPMELQFTNYR